MLGRMFVADETQSLDQMKHDLLTSSNPTPSTCSIASTSRIRFNFKQNSTSRTVANFNDHFVLCEFVAQVDSSPSPMHQQNNIDEIDSSSPTESGDTPSACHLDATFISSNHHLHHTYQTIPGNVSVGNIKTKRDYDDDYSSIDMKTNAAKKHCPDDEEINAQVQSAIDSILNLQRSDPATDEAVRSILPS